MITTVLAYLLFLLFEGPSTRILEIFESDELFKEIKRLQETESIEELKPKDSRSDSENSKTSGSNEQKAVSSNDKEFA